MRERIDLPEALQSQHSTPDRAFPGPAYGAVHKWVEAQLSARPGAKFIGLASRTESRKVPPTEADLDAWGMVGIARTVARMKHRTWFIDVEHARDEAAQPVPMARELTRDDVYPDGAGRE